MKASFKIIIMAGLGIALFIAITLTYVAVNKNTPKEEVQSLSAMQSSIQDKVQAKLPALKNEMTAPKENELIGKWVTKFGASSIAEITLVSGKFELIYTDDPQGRARKYSKGNYKYDEKVGKITLYPSKAAGAPKPISGVAYKIMTLRHYDIFISRKSGEQDIYFTAPDFQIISKNFHPLFLYADYAGAPVLKFSPVQASKSD